MEADDVRRECLPYEGIHGIELIEEKDNRDLRSLAAIEAVFGGIEFMTKSRKDTERRNEQDQRQSSHGSGTSTYCSGPRCQRPSSSSHPSDDGTQKDGDVYPMYGLQSVKPIPADYRTDKTRTRVAAALQLLLHCLRSDRANPRFTGMLIRGTAANPTRMGRGGIGRQLMTQVIGSLSDAGGHIRPSRYLSSTIDVPYHTSGLIGKGARCKTTVATKEEIRSYTTSRSMNSMHGTV